MSMRDDVTELKVRMGVLETHVKDIRQAVSPLLLAVQAFGFISRYKFISVLVAVLGSVSFTVVGCQK